MSMLSRRSILRRFGMAMLTASAASLVAKHLRAQEHAGRVIEIEARRFRYTPNEVTVKRGETVTLALKAVDFTHGFSLPELNVRADLIPGQVVPIRLQPIEVGRFTFLCDNFCGEHHEEMNGTLIVTN